MNGEAAEAAARDMTGSATAHQVDVADAADVSRVFADILAQGSIDILVNNAGIAHIGNVEHTSEADLDRLYGVNIKGIYNCIHAVVGAMKAAGGGVILNMASIAGSVGISDRFAYSMTKGAVLAMTYGIVSNHGGHVEVHSEIGRGSTFNIYLPMAKEGLPQNNIEEDPEANPSFGSGHILIIDDEAMVLGVLEDMLVFLGYDVSAFENGDEAVAYYEAHHDEIDLVIIDMAMPDMNGRACFEAFRTINPGVKALLSSGYAKDGTVQNLLNDGMAGFVQKPYRLIQLSEPVAEAMNKPSA